jgi:tight adherence protein B
VRRRLRVLAGATAVIASALLATGASAKEGITIVESADARFPDRAYILTLPSDLALTSEDVEVRENGNTVSGLSLVPATEAGGSRFAVVLVIDASQSMHGAPIEGAMAAARAFAAHRNPDQKLAVVTFNSTTNVALDFSTSDEEINAALASPPPLALKTHVYDGVQTALDLISAAKLSSASIVVLSDGADTGSTVSREEVSRAARAAHVRIFAVGLRSLRFKPLALKALASEAGGHYSGASSPEDLAGIYDELGARLANQYLVRYRSLAGPEQQIEVGVTVTPLDQTAAAGYETPALPDFSGGAFHEPTGNAFWRSAGSMFLVAFLASLLVASALFLLLRPRNRGLRRRMAEFVSLPLTPGKDGAITDRVFEGTEKSLSRMSWWPRFKEAVELAQIRMPPVQIVLWTVVATIFTGWLVKTLTGSLLLSFLALAVPFGTRAYVYSRVDRRRKQFAEQLPDNLQVMASALRAGHSFIGALSVVIDDSPEPAKSEFRRIIADEQLGVPLEDAIDVVVRRMENRDLEQVALVAALQRQTGGSAAEVIDRVAETIRERFELRRLVQGLTAQGRMARWIVSLLPVFLLIALTFLNPDYMRPLYTHASGRVVLFFASVMVIAGSLVIKRIVNIKV